MSTVVCWEKRLVTLGRALTFLYLQADHARIVISIASRLSRAVKHCSGSLRLHCAYWRVWDLLRLGGP